MQSKVYNIIVKQNTYDILSACTGFYAYVDDSRLYNTFDKLIYTEDLAMFCERAEKLVKESFTLRMVAVDGSLIPCYVTLKQGTVQGQLIITLVDIAALIESEQNLNERFTISRKILELYGDDLFIYDPKTNKINLISKYNIARQDKILSLEEFEKLLRSHVCEERYEDVVEFVLALKQGKRYFELCVDGNIMSEEQEAKYTVIKAASVYENNERVASTGYIHKGIEQSYGTGKTVELDSLTGLLSKGEVTNMAIRTIDVEKQPNVSIAIIDVDYFKKVNDTYGHMVGDETLKKVAAIIEAEVGNKGVVGRIGGDEFFVLFYDAYDLETARERLRSIKNTVNTSFPVNDQNRPAITLSIGCAAYPKDADNYGDLFALADFALYRAKEKGRNRYIIYDKEKHGTLVEIHQTTKLATRINSRGDMSRGDILCVIMSRVFSDEVYPIDKLLDDYIENFDPQRITIYDADRGKVLCMVGAQVPCNHVIEETEKYIHGSFWQKKYVYDDIVINNISLIEGKDEEVYNLMKKQGIFSCIHIKFHDKNQNRCILSLESVTKRIVWNNDHMHYYKLMARTLSEYAIVKVDNEM
ncbi:MAG: GGDEF domain-containing protein [Lachnospiraceae bacterium]|nr:GGDEF domain-containing protein [Lachnospiraceae bacterium]